MKKILITTILIFLFVLKVVAGPGYATIKGTIDLLSDGDKASLRVSKYYDPAFPGFDRTYSCNSRTQWTKNQ